MPDTDKPVQSTTRDLRFNINDYARVRLTDATLALWRDEAERARAAYPTLPGAESIWPLTPPLDAGGYWRAQLWQIINLIGPECIAGGSAVEDCELVLEVRDGKQS
jgi:hypothetical protein